MRFQDISCAPLPSEGRAAIIAAPDTEIYLPENPRGYRYSVEHTLHPNGEGPQYLCAFATSIAAAIALYTTAVNRMDVGCVALYDHQEPRKLGQIYI